MEKTDETRDLAWWQIAQWVPAWHRVVATVVTFALVVFLVLFPAFWLAQALVSTLGLGLEPPIELEGGLETTIVSKLGLALTIGSVIGIMSAFGERDRRYPRWLRRSKTDIRRNLRAGLLYGFIFGIAGGLVINIVEEFTKAIAYGLVAGLTTGIAVALVGSFGERPPQHLGRPQWRKTAVPINLVVGIGTGIMTGLVYGLVAKNGYREGLVVGLATTILAWIVTGVGRPSTEATSPIDPRSSWRWNRQLGLAVGLVTTLAYGLCETLWHGIGGSLVVGLLESLAVGIAVGLIFPTTWQCTLATAHLRLKRETPARLLRFLEDARDRQILRTVGQVYQFRHARLQDRLTPESGNGLTSTRPARRDRSRGRRRQRSAPLSMPE